MWKLFKGEFYRVTRQFLFYVFFLVVGAIMIYFFSQVGDVYKSADLTLWVREAPNAPLHVGYCSGVIAILRKWLGNEVPEFVNRAELVNYYMQFQLGYGILYDTVPHMFLALMLSTFLIGTKFKNRTIHIAVANGYSRQKVFWSTLLFYYLTAVLIYEFWTILYVIYIYGKDLKWAIPHGYLLRCFAIQLYGVLPIFSVPVMITFLSKDILKSSLFNVLWFALHQFAAHMRVPSSVAIWIWPQAIISNRLNFWRPDTVISTTQWLQFAFAPAIMLTLTTVVSYYAFRKADLK